MQTPRPPKPLGIRSPDRPAHSQSLYLLSYPAHPERRKAEVNSQINEKLVHYVGRYTMSKQIYLLHKFKRLVLRMLAVLYLHHRVPKLLERYLLRVALLLRCTTAND
jgi:hypothetical protein